ncbi:ATP-binding protein [Rhodobacteraceae bacterium DSL-40]|uniref:sensor histidine kinase n=1 Tax=Amaricoccus sp. B4 TaxID=3368557 RepID=UPI000DAF22EB
MSLRRSAAARLIVAHLVMVAASTALVLGFLYWRVGGVIDTEQRAVVEAEIRGLADDYNRAGISGLARAIDTRLAQPQTRDAIYLLADAHGRRIAGNLAGWPPTVAPDTGWSTLSLFRLDRNRPTEISALAVRLPGKELLLVGRDVAARAAFDRVLGRAVIWAILAMTLLSLATGWAMVRLMRRRIGAIDGAARAIMGGDLASRVPLRHSGDEFDRLADTLNAMLERIETLVRDLRTVTDSLAHDLRSPLGRLVRHLRDAQAEGLDREARIGLIGQAEAEAETVLSTATALLDISRVEAGIGAEQFEPVDLAALARDMADLYGAVAEEQGISIAVAAGDDGPVVEGHAQLLAQAASNLIDNALKHAPEGSTVTISVTAGEGEAEFAVADCGPGIPAEERARAVERFVRLDPSRGGNGAGLGLALVAAVARMHGAALRLEDNAPGLRVLIAFNTPGVQAGP